MLQPHTVLLWLTWSRDDHHLDPPFHFAPELGHVWQKRQRVPPTLRQSATRELHGALVCAIKRTGLPKIRVPGTSIIVQPISQCLHDLTAAFFILISYILHYTVFTTVPVFFSISINASVVGLRSPTLRQAPPKRVRFLVRNYGTDGFTSRPSHTRIPGCRVDASCPNPLRR